MCIRDRATPAVADVRDMTPDAKLNWEVEESYGDTRSQVVISQQDRQGFWREAAYCRELGPGKTATHPAGASCDPTTYKGDALVQFSVLHAPVCDAGGRNCLREVFATGPDGTRVQGEFLGYVAADSMIPANQTLGNPLGMSSGIWRLPGVLNSAGTDLYEVHLNLSLIHISEPTRPY